MWSDFLKKNATHSTVQYIVTNCCWIPIPKSHVLSLVAGPQKMCSGTLKSANNFWRKNVLKGYPKKNFG